MGRADSMAWIALVVISQGCEPTPPKATPAEAVVAAETSPVRADDCRRDIPDCSAACALRETNHLEFIDWYDRRCAAVVLGKNPDKAAGVEPPDAGMRPSGDDVSQNPYR